MTAPAGVTIGAQWTPKRGRRLDPVTILQIHRADRAVTARVGTDRKVIPWRELRKAWRPI